MHSSCVVTLCALLNPAPMSPPTTPMKAKISKSRLATRMPVEKEPAYD